MNVLNIYKQTVAESQNEASQESAKDMLDRTMKFAQDLSELIDKQRLPRVIIDGMLLANINSTANRHARMAEAVVREEAEEQP